MAYEQQVQEKTTSVAAVWSLVLGILGMLCLGCIAGVPAVICGHMALAHIKKSAGLLTGDGMAIAGLIMGYLSLAAMIFVIPILAGIAIPSFAKARAVGQKQACYENMRQIQIAVTNWAQEENKQDGDSVSEADVMAFWERGGMPVCPKQGVYTFDTVGEPPSCSVHGSLSGFSDRSDDDDSDDYDD